MSFCPIQVPCLLELLFGDEIELLQALEGAVVEEELGIRDVNRVDKLVLVPIHLLRLVNKPGRRSARQAISTGTGRTSECLDLRNAILFGLLELPQCRGK